MAHFALIDENNIVQTVLVVGNEFTHNDEGVEEEQLGINFLKDLLPDQEGTWLQTSYNSNFRYDYASVGGSYDPVKDIFIQPQPFPSWVLDETGHFWEAPVPYPSDTNEPPFYYWNEESGEWVEQEPFPEQEG